MKKFGLMIIRKILKFLAKKMVGKHHPFVIGITGSVGKTSTKEAIALVLEKGQSKTVGKSFGNLNNEYGLPLAILGFKERPQFWQWPITLLIGLGRLLFKKDYPQILVLEMAADKPGDINYLIEIVRPDLGIITNIGPAHFQSFGTLEKVLAEKAELVRILPSDRYALLNGDNRYLKELKSSLACQVLTYGTSEKSDLIALNIEADQKQLSFEVRWRLKSGRIKLNLIGQHFIYPILSALITSQVMGVDWDQAIKILENFQPMIGRTKIFAGKNQTTLIDDSYNANPQSMNAALDTMALINGSRKLAVLGEMLELGERAQSIHHDIGQKAHQVADIVIGVGKLAKEYFPEHWFLTPEAAAEYLLKEIKQGDIILIKGSHAVQMEKIVDQLKE